MTETADRPAPPPAAPVLDRVADALRTALGAELATLHVRTPGRSLVFVTGAPALHPVVAALRTAGPLASPELTDALEGTGDDGRGSLAPDALGVDQVTAALDGRRLDVVPLVGSAGGPVGAILGIGVGTVPAEDGTLGLWLAIAAELLAQRRVALDERIRARHARALADVERAMAAAATPAAVLDVALAALRDRLRVDRTTFLEIDPDGDRFVVVAATGVTAASTGGAGSLSMFLSPEARATLAAGRTLVIDDSSADDRTRAGRRELAARASGAQLAVPLPSGDGLVGLLGASATGPRRWTTEDMAFAEALAARLSPAIERARAAEALRVSEERFRIATTSDSVTVFEQDAELRYVWVYPQRPEFAPDNIGRTDLDLLGSPEGDRLHAIKARVLATGKPAHALAPVTLGDTRIVYELFVERRTAPDGSPRGVAGIALDATARVLAEEQARHESELRRKVAENSTLAMFLMDASGRCTYLNPAAEAMTGYRLEDLGTRPLHDLIHGHRPDGTPYPFEECPIAAALAAGIPVRRHEDIFERRDGSFFPVVCSAEPIAHDGIREGSVLEIRDLTEERAAAAALDESRSHLAMTTEAAGVGTWRWVVATNVVEWSAIHKRQWGLEPTPDPIGYDDWASRVHPDDLGPVEEVLQRALRGEGEYDVEYRITPHGSEEMRWIRSVGRASFDGTGRAEVVQGVSIDVTEAKRREAALRENETRLRAALAAKDEFLGLVSHELRTPMTVILGMSAMLGKGVAPDRARDIGVDIAESATVLNGLVESMLLLARLDQDEAARLREPVLLHRVAEGVVGQHRTIAPERTVRLDVRTRDTLVDVQPAWVERVLDNFLSNALKYAGDRPIDVVVDGEAGEVRLRVLDGGPGLPDDQVGLVFEPFYRAPEARERAPGAGLGLAVARRIVELLGGRIWARTRPEGGAEFGFALPTIADED